MNRVDVLDGEIVPVIEDKEFEELRRRMSELSVDQKAKLATELLPGAITLVLGGNNVINNSFAFQINGTAEEMSKKLENLSNETLATLIEAISIRIRNGTQ